MTGPECCWGGYLANALHNVPGMLVYCNEKGLDTPARIGAYLRGFPEQIQQYGAPECLAATSRQIVSSIGTVQELGLQDDLADVELAPLPKMQEYLNRLYEAFVTMRGIRAYGSRPVDGLWKPWHDLEQVWNAEADAAANYCGAKAALLRVVPQGLVRWSQFDEPRFYAQETAFNAEVSLKYKILIENR